MAVTSFASASSVTLPEGTKALITQGLSSSGMFTYTPTSALPAGSYMLTANPCDTVYAQVNGKQVKSDKGTIAFTTDSSFSSIKFKADQKINFEDVDTFETPNPLHFAIPSGPAVATPSNMTIIGESLGVWYGVNYTSTQANYLIYRSLDRVHWTNTFQSIPDGVNSGEGKNKIATIGNATWILTPNGSQRTTDGGMSWAGWNHNLSFSTHVYGNGIFVGFAGSTVYTSTNGIGWTNRGVKTAQAMLSLIFDGTKFISASYGYVYTSTDGITWTLRTSTAGSTSYACYNLAYNGSNLYMLIDNNNACYTSPDAITWTLKTTFGTGISRNLIWLNGTFAAIAFNVQKTFRTTTDGTTWTTPTIPIFGRQDITYFYEWVLNEAKTDVIIFGATYEGNSYVSYGISSDLTTWRTWSGTNTRPSTFTSLRFAKVGTDYYFSDSRDMYKTSDNGKTWSAWAITTSTATQLHQMSYANGKFFGLGTQSGISYPTYWYSTDGITWTYSGEQKMNGYFSSGFSDGGFLYSLTSSYYYISRMDSEGNSTYVTIGSTQPYLIGNANGFTYYKINGNLAGINWEVNSTFGVSQNGSTAVSTPNSDNTYVYYINGLYFVISDGGTTINTIRFGHRPSVFQGNISVSNTTKFIANINDTLYFAGSTLTGTYNTGDLFPIMKVTNPSKELLTGSSLTNVWEPTGQYIRFSDFIKFSPNANGNIQSAFDGMPPAMQYSNNEFRGVGFLKKQPTVFSLYSTTDTVYN